MHGQCYEPARLGRYRPLPRRVLSWKMRREMGHLPVPVVGLAVLFMVTNAAVILLGRLSGRLSRQESVIYIGLLLIGLVEFAFLVLWVRMRQ